MDCQCQLGAFNQCQDAPSNRSSDICYLACCCEFNLCCSLITDIPTSGYFLSEPIAVTSFFPTEGMSTTRAPWTISNMPQATCSFQWSAEDAQVNFNRMPTINRSRSLVTSTWSPPSIALMDSAIIVGFQLSVYAIPDANSPSCTIESFRMGGNDTDSVEFMWRQIVVTDNPTTMRRYTYRSNSTRFPDTRLTFDSLNNPPYFSIIMTRSGLNGSCWIDCIELQLLYTQSVLTLPPGETARPTPMVGVATNTPAPNTTVLAPMTGGAPTFVVPIDIVIGAAAGAGLLIALLIVAIVCLMRQQKIRKAALSKRKSVAMQVELDSGQATGGARQNIYGLPPDMKTPLPKHVPAPAAGREPVYQQASDIRPIVDGGGAYQSIALGASGEGPAQAYQSLAPEGAPDQAYQALPPEATEKQQQEYRSLAPEKDPLMYVNLSPENDVPVVYETFDGTNKN